MPKNNAVGFVSWTPELQARLLELHTIHGPQWTVIAETMGMRPEQVRKYWLNSMRQRADRIQDSPYPRYDTPLEMEGDALVVPDLEMPFHNADFVNRCLDLCQAWGIDQCIMAGDMLHFDSLSGWEPNWQQANGHGGLDEKQEAAFMDFAKSLGSRQQARAFALLEEIGRKEEDGDPNLSEEMRVARKAVKALTQVFRKVDIVIGNHEGRLLRTLKTPLFPTEITRLVDAQDWRIGPYYFSHLTSGGVRYRIEHPRSAAKSAAETLAAKFHVHVLMGHSHRLSLGWDISGVYYAIQMGCCVDEARLPYASQRSSTQPAHLAGAVIVRDGYPWLLHDQIDWGRLTNLV